MRIVLDTNLLVSGIFWGGLPSKILDLWVDDQISICISEEILDEYLRVIEKIGGVRHQELRKEWGRFIPQHALLFEAKSKKVYSRDPGDDKFIHCALASKAVYLVSGDQDLLVLKDVEGVEIVTAKDFLDREFQ